jgi:predicted RNA-binding protein with PUA-like domain
MKQHLRHQLKTWTEPFQAVWAGLKRYEVRVNDRDYQVGDKLLLLEYFPEQDAYSGREIECLVTYITEKSWGLPDDICVMSIDILRKAHPFSDG